jgi:uncharacterized protein (DUF305 family)
LVAYRRSLDDIAPQTAPESAMARLRLAHAGGMRLRPVSTRRSVRDCERRGSVPGWSAVLAAMLLAATGYAVGRASAAPDLPDESSVDVGFVRDMSVHHAQAATLAVIALDRVTTPAVRDMAKEIARTQLRETGVMAGWLEQWGLPASTTTPAMSWMSHGSPTGGSADPPMPGMATRHEVAQFAVTRGRLADLRFCQLMGPHHRGGVHMIDEVLRRADRPEVKALAEQMRTAQQREIAQLDLLLAELSR